MHRRQQNNQTAGILIMSWGTFLKTIKIIVFSCLVLQGITANAFSELKEDKNLIIEAVICEGNKHTNSDFIKKELYLEKGDILDSNKIFDARLRLGAMPQFEDVHIYLRKGEHKGFVVIVINVTEGAKIQSEISAGIDSRRNLINAKVTDYNFLGTSKILEGRVFASHGRVVDGENYRLGLSYTDPQLFGTNKYFFSASIMSEIFKQDYILDEKFKENKQFIEIDKDNINLGFIAGRRVARYSSVTISVNTGHDKGSELYNQLWLEDTITDTIITDSIDNDYYSIGLSYGWNTLDDSVFPTKGSVFNTRVYAGQTNRQVSNDSVDTGLNMTFSKYWALSPKKTINLSLGHSMGANNYSGGENDDNYSSSNVHCKYIRAIRKKEYNKKIINASWYVGTGLERYYNTKWVNTSRGFNLDLRAGLTFETSSMVYNFFVGGSEF